MPNQELKNELSEAKQTELAARDEIENLVKCLKQVGYLGSSPGLTMHHHLTWPHFHSQEKDFANTKIETVKTELEQYKV